MREDVHRRARRARSPSRRIGVAAWRCAAAVAAAAAAVPARAEEPNVLERIVSVKRSPEGVSAHLIDTPILQVVRAQEERFAGGQREQVRIAATPLFSVFRRDSTTAAEGVLSRTEDESRFASLLGASLLSWRSETEHGLAGAGHVAESEWRLLSLPKLGSLFARRKSEAGSAYEVLYFLHFGVHEPPAEAPPADTPVVE